MFIFRPSNGLLRGKQGLSDRWKTGYFEYTTRYKSRLRWRLQNQLPRSPITGWPQVETNSDEKTETILGGTNAGGGDDSKTNGLGSRIILDDLKLKQIPMKKLKTILDGNNRGGGNYEFKSWPHVLMFSRPKWQRQIQSPHNARIRCLKMKFLTFSIILRF